MMPSATTFAHMTHGRCGLVRPFTRGTSSTTVRFKQRLPPGAYRVVLSQPEPPAGVKATYISRDGFLLTLGGDVQAYTGRYDVVRIG
jgi:hypothetical protein